MILLSPRCSNSGGQEKIRFNYKKREKARKENGKGGEEVARETPAVAKAMAGKRTADAKNKQKIPYPIFHSWAGFQPRGKR